MQHFHFSPMRPTVWADSGPDSPSLHWTATRGPHRTIRLETKTFQKNKTHFRKYFRVIVAAGWAGQAGVRYEIFLFNCRPHLPAPVSAIRSSAQHNSFYTTLHYEPITKSISLHFCVTCPVFSALIWPPIPSGQRAAEHS